MWFLYRMLIRVTTVHAHNISCVIQLCMLLDALLDTQLVSSATGVMINSGALTWHNVSL